MTRPIYDRRGNDPHLAPPHLAFNEEAIKGFLHTNLPDGVLVENITTLKSLGYIEEAKDDMGHLHVGDGQYQIKFPELTVA